MAASDATLRGQTDSGVGVETKSAPGENIGQAPPQANAPTVFNVGDWVRTGKGAHRLVVGDADPRYLNIKNIATQRVTKASAGTLTVAPFEATHDLTVPGETRTPVILVHGVGTKAKPFVSDVSGNARAVLREWLEPHIKPTRVSGVGGAQAVAMAAGAPSLSTGAASSTGDSAAPGTYVGQAGPGVNAQTGAAPSAGSTAVVENNGQAPRQATAPSGFQVGDWVRTGEGALYRVVGAKDQSHLSIKNVVTKDVTKAAAETLSAAPFEPTHYRIRSNKALKPVYRVPGVGTDLVPFVVEANGRSLSVPHYRLLPYLDPAGSLALADDQTEPGAGRLTLPEVHHVLSNTIMNVLDRHENLAGKLDRDDPRYVWRARSYEDHHGYQDWHRYIDDYVTRILTERKDMTVREVNQLLDELYAAPGVSERFPNRPMLTD